MRLAVDMAEYLSAHTEEQKYIRTRLGELRELEGTGPGSRKITIRYDISATPKNTVHTIEITDPLEEDTLARELEAIYRRHNFLPEQPPTKP